MCPNEIIIKSNEYEADFIAITTDGKIIIIEFQDTTTTDEDINRYIVYGTASKYL